MNKALISKVGWRVLNDRTSLWAKVVRGKYRVGEVHDPSWMVAKSNWLSLWRSVGIGLREVVREGCRWVIGDGKHIRFWENKWMADTPLIDQVVGILPDELKNLTAWDLWIDGAGWDFTKIAPYVTENRRLELMAMVVDSTTGAQDRLAWNGSENGVFTVSSAYRLLTRNYMHRQNITSFFKRVWRVVAPERVKVFFWLVVNQVIMTNSERKRRHLGDDDVCQVCKGGIETIIHVLRDCPAMIGIWNRLVPVRKRQVFFA